MKKLIERIRKILRDRRTRQFFTRFVSVTAAIVVFVTTYALVLPAITMEKEAQCGIPAHQHDDNCYEEVLVCGLEESEDHQHTDDCYEKKLICGLEAHTHSASCYSDEIPVDDEESAAVAATHSLAGAVSENGNNENSFASYTNDFGGTNVAAEENIQNSEDNDFEESVDAASSGKDGLLDDCNESSVIGGFSSDTETADNDSSEDPEEVSTDDQEFYTAQDAAPEETEYSDEDNSDEDNDTDNDTASENDAVTEDTTEDNDTAEENATEESAIEDTDPTASEDINDNSETEDSSEGDEAGAPVGETNTDDSTDLSNETGIEASEGETASDAFSEENGSDASEGETASEAVPEDNSAEIEQADTARTDAGSEDNTEANTYVPTLEPVDFNKILTSSTGIYYYHRDSESDAEADASAEADDKTTPVTSAEITDWKPVEEDTILAQEDLIRVYLRYSVPAGQLNETNTVARYRLPENLVLSEEQIEEINKAENGISAQYLDYDTLEVKDPVAHEESLGVEAVEGTRTPDQNVDDYLAGISGSDSDAQEYISATVKVENIYETDETDERYEEDATNYENEERADNGEDGTNGTWLGQDLIFTFTPYIVEKNRHEYDSSGQLTKAGQEVEGWLTLDFNMGQVKWIETDRTAQTEDNVIESETETGNNTDYSEESTEDPTRVVTDPDKEETDVKDPVRNPEDSSENTSTVSEADAVSDKGNDVTDDSTTNEYNETTTEDPSDREVVNEGEESAQTAGNSEHSNDEAANEVTDPEKNTNENEDETTNYESASADSAYNGVIDDIGDTAQSDNTVEHSTDEAADNDPDTGKNADENADTSSETGADSSDNGAVSDNNNNEASNKETDSDIDADGMSLETEPDSSSEKETEKLNVEKQDTPNSVKTATTVRKEAEIIFVEEIIEDRENNIETLDKISTKLTLVEKSAEEIGASEEASEESVEEEKTNASSDDSIDVGFTSEDESDKDGARPENTTEENEDDEAAVVMPAVVFDDSITVTSGSLNSDTEDAEHEDTTISVHVEAEEDTFPEGTKMVLATVSDEQMESVAAAVEGAVTSDETVSNTTRGFHAVDISFFDKDGNEIEPQNPIRVSMKSDSIKKAVEDSSTVPVVVHVENKSVETTAGEEETVEGENAETSGDSGREKLNGQDTSETDTNSLTATVIETKEATSLDGQTNTENEAADTLSFEAGSFSVYAVVYTVDFCWEVNGKTYRFSIPGGGFVSFQQLVEVLGIANQDVHNITCEDGDKVYNASFTLGDLEISEDTREFVRDVDNISFSSPELLSVSKIEENTTVGAIKDQLGLICEYSTNLTEEQITKINSTSVDNGDWALISLKAFESEEYLTITMKTGESFQIKVTDAQSDAIMNGGQVQTIANPNGTTIDLFDYWIDVNNPSASGKSGWPDFNQYGTNNNYYNGVWLNGTGVNKGINSNGSGNDGSGNGHALKFNPSQDETVVNGARNNWTHVARNNGEGVNAWTGSAIPRQGIVQNKLVDGYPKLTNDTTNLGTNGESLNYLFDPSVSHRGKASYTGVDQLLYVDPDGYYTYDSEDFYADLNDTNIHSGNTFTVTSQGNNSGVERGFWPFGKQNFWLGMHMKTNFSMPVDGKVLSPKGVNEDMIFEFQGDDDTWLYLDDVLVGDAGGVHNQTLVRINFRDGTVLITAKEDHAGFSQNWERTYYLDDLYRTAGRYNDFEWVNSPSGNGHMTFKPGSDHQFDMFYMERGGGYSNLRIHYNLVSTTDMTAHKAYYADDDPATADTDESRLIRDQYQFELIGFDNLSYDGDLVTAVMPDNGTENGNNTVADPTKVHIDTAPVGLTFPTELNLGPHTSLITGVTEDGNVNFGNVQTSVGQLGKEYYYVVREIVPDDAVNADGIDWEHASPEERAAGGFIKGGITYDGKVYYFKGKVIQEGENKYVLKKTRYTDSTYQTVDEETKFFSFVNTRIEPLNLKVVKKGDDNRLLAGAEFSLSRAKKDETDSSKWIVNENVPTVEKTTGSNGEILFENLAEGNYILEEKNPPAGYQASDSRWLITLTKTESTKTVNGKVYPILVLVPTVTVLNSDGAAISSATQKSVVNGVFEQDVENSLLPPFTVSVNKSWLGADNQPLEQSEYSAYTAKFKLHRLRTYTTPGNVVTGDDVTLTVGHVNNDPGQGDPNPWGTWGRVPYKYLRGESVTINYNYHGQTSNSNKRQYRYSTNGSSWSYSGNLNDTGFFNVTIPNSGIYYIDFYDSNNIVSWTITDNGSDGETVIDQLDEEFERDYANNESYSLTLTNGQTTGTFIPGPFASASDAGKFPASETKGGIFYGYKYYIEEMTGETGFETIYVDGAGNMVSETNLEDLASTSGQQTVINRKLMDIPVEKTWPDYDEDDEYTWTAKLQLDYRNVPLDGESEEDDQGSSGDEEDHETSWSRYEPATYVEISKGDAVQKFFEDLPMYYTDSNGVTWRREYSVREAEYYVWKLDDHGDRIQPAVVSKNSQGEMEGYEYTLWYKREAGEDYNNDGIITEDDYEMSVVNMLAHRVVKEKINLNIDKNWPNGTSYATSDGAKAKFRLRRYVVEEYRNYETVDSDATWVDITLDTGKESLQTLRVPQGQNMFIRGYVKGGTKEQNISFTSSDGASIPPHSVDNSASPNQREFVIPFTADITKTITLVSGADDVSGGIYGIHLSDTNDMLAPEVDSSFSMEFELKNANEWHKAFADLPVVEVVEMNQGLTATTFMYSYFFEEIECVPETFYAVFTDSNGEVLIGDENNRIIFSTDIVANNLPIGFDILKVDLKDNSKKLPGAEFTLRKLDEDDELHYPVPASGGTFPGTTVDTSETENGQTSFTELFPGFYEVSETKAPSGYILVDDTVFYLKVEKTGDIKLLKKQTQDETVILVEASPGEMVGNSTLSSSLSAGGRTIEITVRNEPGAALPNAGGSGTNFFHLIGCILTMLASVGIVMKRRRREAV